MKRTITFALTFIFTFISIPLSSATTLNGEEIFILADTRNRDLDGNFYDTSLESKLASTGSLGQLLATAQSRPLNGRILFIDPMLIEEVQDLIDGYTLIDGQEVESSEIARLWFDRLTSLISGDQIAAVLYGNPDFTFLRRSAPSELRIQEQLAQQRLAELLSREVSNLSSLPTTAQALPPFTRERFTALRKEIRAINRYAENPVTRNLRLTNASLLNPGIPSDRSIELAKELTVRVRDYANSVRITKGRFTLTSKRERLPLTLINDFTNEVTVKFRLSSSNSRIVVSRIEPITIPAESKVPLTIPIEVLASGQSEVIIEMRSGKGEPLGEIVRLPVNLAVISPLTTWITTGSGLILLFAAIIQSLRRVQRSRRRTVGEDG